VQPHADTRFQVLRDKRRHSDTKVDVETILNLFRGTFRNTMALSNSGSLFRRYRLVFVLAWLLGEGDYLDALINGGGYDAVDVDPRKVDGIRRQAANRNDVLGLGNVVSLEKLQNEIEHTSIIVNLAFLAITVLKLFEA
jgi:hypothetical protein